MFDMEKLYWLNRHYIKKSPPERIEKLAEPYFIKAGMLPENPDEPTRAWFGKVVALLAPSVNKLDELPERAALIFQVDAPARWLRPTTLKYWRGPKAERSPRQPLPNSPRPTSQPMTPERFKAIMNEVKAKTETKGKDLFHPVRIVFTGSHSGPEFDKLIPILEEGSQLPLPMHVMNTQERLAAFKAAR